MIDLTRDVPSSPDADPVDRPSFRRRLLTTVGPAVAAALAVVVLLAWGATYWIFHHNAIEALDAEVNEMRADVTIRGDSVGTESYAWREAHHRLAVERVDPIFVQVFDRRNRLLRQSANINALPDTYPQRLLAGQTQSGLVPSLHVVEVGDRSLYYRVGELRNEAGQTVGYVQVARGIPPHRATLQAFAAGLGVLWLLLTGGVLALVSWAAGRVLSPLREMTEVARSVTSADLTARVDVPAESDRETAVLGNAFNALLDRIESYVDRLRTFTSNAAHELQTPLTVLRGHVEIALRRERSPDRYRETLELLDDRLGEFVQTLRALLTLTRLDRDDELDTEPVDLSDIVSDESSSMASRADTSGLSLTVDAPAPAWVDGQPQLLREAVRNLIDNALKYTPDGEVSVSVEADGKTVVFACRDTGVGIDADELDRIGSRFFRGAEAGQIAAEGSGLGLSIVARIVELHGGVLRADSERGEGTHVEIHLPATGTGTSTKTRTAEPSASDGW